VAEALDPRVVRTRADVLQATIDVLVDEGWDAVTHPHVARVAGYAKATLYAHWPDRVALVRDAFARFGEMPHATPVGTLREDLVTELRSFRTAMVEHRLDRALAVLAERAPSVPELAPVLTAFVADGERPMRQRLAPLLAPPDVEVAVLMLCGGLLHGVLMHAQHPSDAWIERAVDGVLRGFDLDPAA
jgi:AcrR family transcriptional regulator